MVKIKGGNLKEKQNTKNNELKPKQNENALLNDLIKNPQKYGLQKNLILIDNFNDETNQKEAMKFLEEILKKRNIEKIDQINGVLFFINHIYFMNLNCKPKNKNEFQFECQCKIMKEKSLYLKCNFNASYNIRSKKLIVHNKHIIPTFIEYQITNKIRYNCKLEEKIKEFKNSFK